MHSYIRVVLTLMLLAVFMPRTEAVSQDWYNMNSTENEGMGFRVYGDYIYWKVTEDHLDYAAVIPGGLTPVIDALGAGVPFDITVPLDFREPSFNYQSGFKVGLGYTVPCSDWDFDVCWTRLNNDVKTSVTDATGGIIPITFNAPEIIELLSSGFSSFAFGTEATNTWRFEYNIVDLVVGKKMQFCNCVKFRPYVGAKFASIRQKQYLNYFGLEIFHGSTAAPTPLIISNFRKNDFRGVGPSFGFDAAWQFMPDWNLTSGLGGALVYGKFDVHETPSFGLFDDSISVAVQTSKNCRFSPTVNGNIGIDWEASFFDSFQMKIGVAYEVQYWWNQWRPTTIANSILSGNSSAAGDLMMQGLTVQASFGF